MGMSAFNRLEWWIPTGGWWLLWSPSVNSSSEDPSSQGEFPCRNVWRGHGRRNEKYRRSVSVGRNGVEGWRCMGAGECGGVNGGNNGSYLAHWIGVLFFHQFGNLAQHLILECHQLRSSNMGITLLGHGLSCTEEGVAVRALIPDVVVIVNDRIILQYYDYFIKQVEFDGI